MSAWIAWAICGALGAATSWLWWRDRDSRFTQEDHEWCDEHRIDSRK